jgi:plasmid stabilization system protein ParE
MGLRVAWSPEAADDLEEIVAFIARDSQSYARAVASKTLTTAKSLGRFPHIGRAVPEVEDPSIRERFVFSYRLIYRVEQHRVLILAIVHGRRLLEGFQQRLE